MITPPARSLIYRLDGTYTTGAGTWTVLVDKFGTPWYYDTYTNYGNYIEFRIPSSVLTSANLPGTLYLQVNAVTIKSFAIGQSTESATAEVAADTFGDYFTTYSTTASTATVAITQGTYPGWDGVNSALGWASWTPSKFEVNGNLIPFSGNPNAAYIAPAGEGASIQVKPIDIEFNISGATYFALLVTTAGYATVEDCRVWVDGLEVSGGPFTLPAGNLNSINVTLPNTSAHTIRFAGPMFVSYLVYNSGTTFNDVTPRKTFGIVSDSYYEAMSWTSQTDVQPIWLKSQTGWRVWNMAQGGTGFMNPYQGACSVFGSTTRLALLRDAPIDALIVNGSVNDQQNYTISQITTAQKAFLDAVHAMRPTLPIIQILPEDSPYFQANIGDATALNSAMKVVAEAHKSVVGVINPIEGNWVYGSGYQGATNGTGNADNLIGTDAVHLSRTGAVYFAGWTARQIARMPIANGN